MNSGNIIDYIVSLIDFFRNRCSDTAVMEELRRMALDKRSWPQTHALFDRIRVRTLEAERAADCKLAAQRLFEEVIAKTLYNLSYSSAPFDPDSPFFVIPNAIALATSIGPEATAEIGSLLGLPRAGRT